MIAYPQLACGAATFLHLCEGEWHAIPGLGRPGTSSTSGERGRKAGFSVQYEVIVVLFVISSFFFVRNDRFPSIFLCKEWSYFRRYFLWEMIVFSVICKKRRKKRQKTTKKRSFLTSKRRLKRRKLMKTKKMTSKRKPWYKKYSGRTATLKNIESNAIYKSADYIRPFILINLDLGTQWWWWCWVGGGGGISAEQ